MTPDRWQEVKTLIENQFKVLDNYSEDLDPGTSEVIEFESPLGKLKACFVKRPKMLDKKTSYSNRVGSEVSVDYVFSEDETVSPLEVFKWDDAKDDWTEFSDSNMFSAS